MAHHTVTTDFVNRASAAIRAHERRPINTLPALEKRVRLSGGGTSSGGDGSGSSVCECGTPIEVGTVEVEGILFATTYTFQDPLNENGLISVTWDSELEYWVSDDYEIECPEDPEDSPPEE